MASRKNKGKGVTSKSRQAAKPNYGQSKFVSRYIAEKFYRTIATKALILGFMP